MKTGGFVSQIITSYHRFRKVLPGNAVGDRPANLDLGYREELRLARELLIRSRAGAWVRSVTVRIEPKR
jgi:hypothetical protein